MPRGSKAKDTSKPKRRAAQFEESSDKKGAAKKATAGRAYAMVNKDESGGKKPGGSGRGKKPTRTASKKVVRKGARTTARTRANRR